MPQVKAWTEIDRHTPDALAEDIARRIRAAVQWRRWLGSKLEHAMDQAATPCGSLPGAFGRSFVARSTA